MNFLITKFKQTFYKYILFSYLFFPLITFGQQIITVTNNSDSGPGSFREAINNATANDTIIFSGLIYPDTIRLTSGEINLSVVPIVIYGPGVDSLSISGEDSSRIFSFSGGDLEAHGLSFNHGYVYGFQNGGAFDIGSGALSLFDCIVSENQAIGDSTTPSSAGLGGAFYNNGMLTLVRTAVFSNRSTGGFGNDGYGGAIYQASGTCTIINSTISDNIVEGGPATVGNNVGIGGAIASQSGNMNIRSSTIVLNNAIDGAGGGIFNFPGSTIAINNSIIAQNISTADTDVSGPFNNLGYNLVENPGSTAGTWILNDLTGVNPTLGPLQFNGGYTPNYGLLPNSPAIDIGDTTITDTIDQRGFQRVQDGNGDDIAIIDIGSYEAVVPDKPVNLIATHGDKTIHLTWNYNNTDGISQFNIYRDSTITPIANITTQTTSFTDTNLVNGQAYIYFVSAVDTIGFESSFSLPDSATPNGPPIWTFPQNFFSFNEDDSLTVDLDDFLLDDSDPDSSLIINPTQGYFTSIIVDPISHVASIYAAPDSFGQDTIILNAIDPEGLFISDTFQVNVLPINDLPIISDIPDTTIYTFNNFNYQINATDIDNDSLSYSDNTNLFNIDSSGLIMFRPTLNDTGVYNIIVFISDNDTTVSDTFNLTIESSNVSAPVNVSSVPLDKAFTFSWDNPTNAFYSGTRIVLRRDKAVVHPDSGFLVLDTLFTSTGNVTATIANLDIAATYHFMIFNYYRENSDLLLSNFITGFDSTLAPLVNIDTTLRVFDVINSATFDTSITLVNSGGGTLIGKFSYSPTAAQASWFNMDTTLKIIPPFSTLDIPMRINIPSQLLDTLLSINVSLNTNQPQWQIPTIEINVNNIFDRFAPMLSVVSEPDSIVTQAAVKFEFSANDTLGSKIGDLPEQLFFKYALYNMTTNQYIQFDDSLQNNEIVFYPLTDGNYEFSLWAYDRSGNGNQINDVAFIDRFIINAAQRFIPDRKWIMSSIPRDKSYSIPVLASDSSFVIFRWNARNEEYNRIVNNRLEPGMGYWIYSAKKSLINVNNIPFQALNDSVIIPIQSGWNQIGIPMPFEMEMNRAQFIQGTNVSAPSISLIQAISDSLVSPAIYWYKSIGNVSGYDWAFIDTSFVEPWRGYWIYSNVSGNLIYPKEPSFRNTAITPTKLNNNLADTWEINLSLTCNELSDSKNIVGTHIGKQYLIKEPPVLDQHVSLYFKSGDKDLAGFYSAPLKDQNDLKKYNVIIETSEMNQLHTIKWQLPENSLYFYLVDNHFEKIIDLREANEYTMLLSSKTHHMILYATYDANFKPGIIPVDFKLKQNYPNPFNPVTTIEFGIPEQGQDQITTLRIFNILGQQVVMLVNNKLNPGYHRITWNGLNKSNQKVASGLYFYSLSNGKTELFKKMIFIK